VTGVIVGPCACLPRIIAVLRREFCYVREYEGFIFPEGPKRKTTWKSCQATGGEPYVYHDCPWCGGDLKPPSEQLPPFQADGGSA
jgi:hypothetical protein